MLAFTLTAATAARATVAVHGMNQDALGSASLSVAGDPFTGYQLNVANIGSSGNDGVSIELPRTNGLWLVYGTPPPAGPGLPPKAIVHRDLAARFFGQAPTDSLHHMIESQGLSGTGVDLTFSLPGSPEVVLELFNGSAMVYSSRRGYKYYQAQGALHLDGPTVTVDEPGVAVAFRFGRPAVNTALSSSSFEMVRPAPCDVTIEGVTYVADRIVVRLAPLHNGLETRCIEGIVRASCLDDGSGGSADMAISCKGAPAVRIKKKAKAHGMTVSGVAGVTLADGGGTGDAQRLRVLPHLGPVADPALVNVWQLPPGEPALSRFMEETTLRFQPASFEMPMGQSLAVTARAGGIAGGVIAAIVIAARVTVTAVSPTDFDFTAGSDDPAQTGHIELFKKQPGAGSGVKVHEGGQGTFMVTLSRSSTKPRSQVTSCESGLCRMGFGMPPGTTITVGGTPYDADSLVIVFDAGSVPALGITDLELRPSQGTQFTLVSTECTPLGGSVPGAARPAFTWGSALATQAPDSTLTFSNIGSSGNDGVSFVTNGLPSVQIPFANGLALALGEGFQLDADPCFEGECEPTSSLRVGPKRLVNSKFVVRFTTQGNNPLFIEAGGVIAPYRDSDSDDDGEIEIEIPPGLSGDIASIGYSQLSPYREAASLTFSTMVTLKRAGGDQDIPAGQTMRIWRNIDGAAVGAPAPTARVISLNGLPPGQPYFRSIEGVGFDRVMLSGTGSDASLANNNIDGFPVIPTWTTIAGPGEPFKRETGSVFSTTFPAIVHVYTPALGGAPDNGPIVLRSGGDTGPAADPSQGFVLAADLDSIVPGPDGIIGAAVAGGIAGGVVAAKTASLTVMGTPGGGAVHSLHYDHSLIATSVACDLYLGGVLQHRAVDPISIECDAPPVLVALHTPQGRGGGVLHSECRFRAPVSVTVDGLVVACDRLEFVPLAGAQVVNVTSFKFSLTGLLPGEALTNVQLGEIVPESEILAAPDTGPGAGVAPMQFALSRAYPNPMRATSTVRFAVPARQHVRAVIMDVAGREVARLTDRDFEAGEHTLRWNGMGEGGAPVPAGLYFVRIQAAGKSKVTRLTRLQ